MIYFDNSATGGFKPNAVTENAINAIKYLSANPGRSAHRLALTGLNLTYSVREQAGKTFGTIPEKVIFTKNCTEGLNYAIFGSLKKGGHVITSAYEHNSVLRPLFYLKEQGLISLSVIDCKKEEFLLRAKEERCDKTYLVVLTSASNVTGEVFPVKEIGDFCKENDLIFICDGAQGGGHIPLNVREQNISYLSLSGHKGLFGIMGSGLLIINEKFDLNPIIFGGTGTESFNLSQPLSYPERLESGTINLPAVCALKEGLAYLENNLEKIGEILENYTEFLIGELNKIPKVKVYSNKNPIGITSFKIDGIPSGEVADRLDKDYDIAVRAGLFCSPLTHKLLGTEEDGLIRVSLSTFNTVREMKVFLRAIKEIV